jgi:hypothetical protein
VRGSNSATRIAAAIGVKALWAPLLVFILHGIAAQRLGHEPYVDSVSHFSGGIAIAFFFWRSAECFQRSISDRWIIGATVLVAIAWEIMEVGLAIDDGWIMYWSLTNVLRDLVLGLSGDTVFVVLKNKNRPRSPGASRA